MDQFTAEEHPYAKDFQDWTNTTKEGENIIVLVFKNNEVLRKEETLSYDIFNFVGEVGGSLGFFLGASAITFYDLISNYCQSKMSNFCPKM